jgi:hypothetical protein
MKKTILLLVSASALSVGMTSCKKGEREPEQPKPAIQQSYDAKLVANQTYTFALPKNLRDDHYEILSEAQHFSLSQVTENANGDYIYTYKPAADYVGADQVILSNDWEREEMPEHKEHHKHHLLPPPGGRKHHGNCEKKGEEDHYIITINFNMDRVNDTVH